MIENTKLKKNMYKMNLRTMKKIAQKGKQKW